MAKMERLSTSVVLQSALFAYSEAVATDEGAQWSRVGAGFIHVFTVNDCGTLHKIWPGLCLHENIKEVKKMSIGIDAESNIHQQKDTPLSSALVETCDCLSRTFLCPCHGFPASP